MRRLPRAASKTMYWRSSSSGAYSSKIHERSCWMSMERLAYKFRQHERSVDARDTALRFEARGRALRLIVVPVEQALHLLRRDTARELEQPSQQRRHSVVRCDPLRALHRLGIATHEQVVRVVVVLATLADRLHARDVHEPL